MNTYIIKFTMKSKVIDTWERQGDDMETCLAEAKYDYRATKGEFGGVFICRKTTH
jgi:hypothetical protein